ncbi:hypothetical protein GCM10011408_10110 [Dyella caseinilytica]|nr:hypothetical protein GCM10011408_10110 [Dyella caseinilytica]
MRKRNVVKNRSCHARAAAQRHVTLAINITTPDNGASSQAGRERPCSRLDARHGHARKHRIIPYFGFPD